MTLSGVASHNLPTMLKAMTTDSSVITKAFFLYLRIRQGNKQYRSKGKIFFLFVTFFKFYETFFCKEKKKKNLFKIFSLKSNFLISYLDESNFFLPPSHSCDKQDCCQATTSRVYFYCPLCCSRVVRHLTLSFCSIYFLFHL